jgi:hypothetical protein
MFDPQTQRERTSIKQLSAVSQARQIRLQTERQALAQRERALEQAWANQHVDEELLEQQRVLWAGCWQAWAQVGGALRRSVSLRQDKELLTEMAVLMAQARAKLQAQTDALKADLSAWAQRWHGAQAFEESLLARGRVLRVSLERASERQRDEESLMTLVAPQTGAVMFAAQAG